MEPRATDTQRAPRDHRRLGTLYMALGVVMVIIAAVCLYLLLAYVPEDFTPLIAIEIAAVAAIGALSTLNGGYVARTGRQNRVLRPVIMAAGLVFIGCLVASNRASR